MFGAEPRAREFSPVPILTWKEGAHEQLVVLSDVVEGVYTHYFDRSFLCPVADCSLCEGGRRARYYAFLTVGLRGRKWLLRLTDAPANSLLGAPPSPGAVLSVQCTAVRRALRVRRHVGTKVQHGDVVSRVEQLRTLWALFCLGPLPPPCDAESLVSLAQAAAREKIHSSHPFLS